MEKKSPMHNVRSIMEHSPIYRPLIRLCTYLGQGTNVYVLDFDLFMCTETPCIMAITWANSDCLISTNPTINGFSFIFLKKQPGVPPKCTRTCMLSRSTYMKPPRPGGGRPDGSWPLRPCTWERDRCFTLMAGFYRHTLPVFFLNYKTNK